MAASPVHGDVDAFLSRSGGLRTRLERALEEAAAVETAGGGGSPRATAEERKEASFPFESSLVCFFFPTARPGEVSVFSAPWVREATAQKYRLPVPRKPSNAVGQGNVPVDVRAVWLEAAGSAYSAVGSTGGAGGGVTGGGGSGGGLAVCSRSLGVHNFWFGDGDGAGTDGGAARPVTTAAATAPAAETMPLAGPVNPAAMAAAFRQLNMLAGGSDAAKRQQEMLVEAACGDGVESGGGGGGGSGGGGGGGGGASQYTISQPRATTHSAVDLHMALQALADDIELMQEELKECEDDEERAEKQEQLHEAIIERAQLEEVLAAHAGDDPSLAAAVGMGGGSSPSPSPTASSAAAASAALSPVHQQHQQHQQQAVPGVGVVPAPGAGPLAAGGGSPHHTLDSIVAAPSPPASPFAEVQRRLSGLPQARGAQQERAEELRWRFTQSFGDDNSSDDDLVTAMEFDKTGRWLAVGDKAGRICVFEGFMPEANSRHLYMDYRFYTEFQSHEPEFDCLKSLEIEEKINVIRWVNTPSTGQFILSANDKTIKLWKLHEKRLYEEAPRPEPEEDGGDGGGPKLRVPPRRNYQVLKTASRKRVYAHAHQYHINSLSINPDGETFVSVDDLRINMWHLENNTESFNIIDIKPHDLKQLNEVITTAAFHPQACNLLMYGTSRGNIRVTDMRQRALCEQWARQFQNEALSQTNHFFTEIISSVSSAEFTPDGMSVLSRDYLTTKVWDLRNETRPVHTVPVHDYLTPYLPELYENDCLFDRFSCSSNAAGTSFVTGSYNNHFLIHNTETRHSTTLEAKDDPRDGNTEVGDEPNVDAMDFARKALHTAWHPQQDVLAIAGVNKIYIYSAQQGDAVRQAL